MEGAQQSHGLHESTVNKLFWIICFSQFIIPYMVSGVGLAIPSLGSEMGASALQLGFVEQFYLLPMAMSMLTFGRLGDIVGYGKVFSGGFVLFTIFTAILGFVHDINVFIGVRFFQGLAAAIVLSVSLSLISSLFPPEVRGRKFGVLSGFIYGGMSAGPVIGGLLTSQFGWRSLFYTVTPVCVVLSVFGLMRLWRARCELQNEKMDYKGGIVYALALLLFMAGASRTATVAGWIILAVGVIGIVAFYHLEKRVKSPLVNVHLLRSNKVLTFGLLAAMGNYASIFGLTFFMSLYLQYSLHLSPRVAGVILLVQPLVMVLLSPSLGKLADRVDPGKLSNLGVGIICVCLLCIAGTVGRSFALYLIPVELLFIGVGYGVFIIPNTLVIMGSVEPKEYGVASGLIGTMRVVGMVISITAVTIIFSLVMGGAAVNERTLPELLFSMRVGMIIFAFFAFLGVSSAFISSKEMRSRHSGPAEQAGREKA